jgi:acyl-CoA dehydrogenase
MLNFNLTPAQLELQSRAREFALKEVLPVSWQYDEKDEVPLFLLEKAFETGLINGDIPEQYGGRGAGLIDAALVTEEVAAACPGIATSLFDNSLGIIALTLSSNEALKERIFSHILREFKLICFATSEPTMGSDVAGMDCRAIPDGEDYILNGTKYWVTNGGIADYQVIFASTNPALKHKGIGAFLVDRNWEGVSAGRPILKLGQRCSNTAAIHLKDVRVPKGNIIALPGEGFLLAMRTFGRTRPIIGAFAVGAARSAMEYAIDYAKKRHTFGAAISSYQAIQFKIADMFQKVETARLLVWKAAWEADQGLDPTISASITKFYATEKALEVVNEALQIMGGYGYTRMFPVEKLFRDTRVFPIYEGTSEIQRLIVSAHALFSYKPVMPPLDDIPMLKEWDRAESADMKNKTRTAWRCRICGYIHYDPDPPEVCPYCFFPKSIFKKVWPVGVI